MTRIREKILLKYQSEIFLEALSPKETEEAGCYPEACVVLGRNHRRDVSCLDLWRWGVGKGLGIHGRFDGGVQSI